MENSIIQITEDQEITINVDQKVVFYVDPLDGAITMYNIVDGIRYALVIPNKPTKNVWDLNIDCKLFEVGTN